MKFKDTLRIALHNLRLNLSRSVLTAVIVALVSALVMSLLLIGIAFPQNRDEYGKLIIRREGAAYTLYDEILRGHSLTTWEPLTDGEYDFLRESAARHGLAVTDGKMVYTASGISLHAVYGSRLSDLPENKLDWLPLSTPLSRFDLKELRYQNVPEDFVVSGRMWTEEDGTEPLVWVNRTIAETNGIGAGDPVVFYTYLRGSRDEIAPYPAEYTVAGIYDPSVLDSAVRSFYSVDFFMGYDGFRARIPEDAQYRWTREVDYLCYPPTDDYSYGALSREIESFLEEVNGQLGKVAALYNERLLSVSRFRNEHIDEFQIVNQINLIVVGISLMLSFIVLLLCIGSVANTVVISVDRNKKFLGLLKALGLTAGGIRRIVLTEIFLLILIGILPGVGLLFAVSGGLRAAVEMLFSLLYSSVAVHYTVSLAVPFWLPVATALFFFLFAYLFSRKSMSKIVGQDAIRTLGEVS